MDRIPYRLVLKDAKDPFNNRCDMVCYAMKQGIKPASRHYSCSRNTIRKWLRRYTTDQSLTALKNRSRKPRYSPNMTPEHEAKEIRKLRDSLKKIGARRMQYEFDIKRSVSAIHRIIKQSNNPPRRRKKHVTKNDLREEKQKLKIFEKIQIDIKDLCDIPYYWKQMVLYKLPRYQFTARDVKSGALFIAYGRNKDCVNASTFCAYLLQHLKRFNIDVSKINIQTDNDGAFVGNSSPKSSAPFKYIIEQIYKATHLRIPPSAPTYNSDVETSHIRIEEEFYDIEDFGSHRNFLNKALTYQVYFNLIRPNTYKDMKSPIKIVEEEMGAVDPYLLIHPPVLLENLFELYEKTVTGGHHVPRIPRFSKLSAQNKMKLAVFSLDNNIGGSYGRTSGNFKKGKVCL